MTVTAHVSLACLPGASFQAASRLIEEPPTDPVSGRLAVDHVQLVPQTWGQLTPDLADDLLCEHGGTSFRLHANVRVLEQHRLADLSTFADDADWFAAAAAMSKRLGAGAYTAHAGRRANANLQQVFDNARRCADLFGCPVGIEGLYPAPGDPWLLSTWGEYEALLRSGVPFALDLSHLHIVACSTGVRRVDLVRELLASESCLEIHISGNDGRSDRHSICTDPTWWHPLLAEASTTAVVFCESNFRSTYQHG